MEEHRKVTDIRNTSVGMITTPRGRCELRPVSDLGLSVCSRRFGMCLLLLLLCYSGSVSSEVLETVHKNKYQAADSLVQQAEILQTRARHVLQRSDVGFGTSHCQTGDRKPHPLKCDRFLRCSAGLYHTVRCPLHSAYDFDKKECSRGFPCEDVTNHVLKRRRRALDDTGVPPNENNGNNEPGSGEIAPDTNLDISPKDNATEGASDLVDEVAATKITSKSTTATTTATTTTMEETTSQTTTKAAATTTNTTAPVAVTVGQTNATSPKYTTMEVVIPGESPKPPYVIITEPPVEEGTTTKNMTILGDPSKGAGVGAIIGIIVALLLIGAIIAVVVVLVKKKKIKMSAKLPVKRKKKIVTRMENPQYGSGQAFRFSRDSTLYVGPTSTTLTKFNNPNLADTPVPRVLQSDEPTPKRHGSLPRSIASRRDKRRAPAPPNPFGEDNDDTQADLYEKASQGSAEVELHTFTVKNELATEPDDNENVEPSYPLLKRKDKEKADQEKSSSLENGKVKKDSKPEVTPQEPNDKETNDGNDATKSNQNKSATSLDKISADFTLDEYDMTSNPFFAKN